jgi:glutamate N-acetyltransferase/amino-acid N-acetyltransferase
MTTCEVKGFRAAGIHCGIKPDGEKDLSLVVSDRPCTAAGVFTTNRVKAASVLYNRSILTGPDAPVRAVIANSGCANACTGQEGLSNTQEAAKQAAGALGCQPEEVLMLSTGVIGVQLPMDVLLPGIGRISGQVVSDGWRDAAEGIMTTDTHPKVASLTTPAGYTITGIAKGAGMIAPDMATMLAVVVTDAQLDRPTLDKALRQAADKSFNRIVIDGDMSTNDTVLLLANGASGVQINNGDAEFTGALEQVCIELAQALVRDGEGATKFVTLRVTGALDVESANDVARAIATSPLCKTAFYGADPNWGRIICAAGYAGVPIEPDILSLFMLSADETVSIQLVEQGMPCDYDEPAAIALMEKPEWNVHLDLGMGEASTTVWTCDLSTEYVVINGEYRT